MRCSQSFSRRIISLFFCMLLFSIGVRADDSEKVYSKSHLGSLTIPWRRTKKRDAGALLLALTAAALSFLLVGIPPRASADHSLVAVFFFAAVAICAMILPGISGAFLLLIFGIYEPTLTAVHDRDLLYVGVFGAGAAVGGEQRRHHESEEDLVDRVLDEVGGVEVDGERDTLGQLRPHLLHPGLDVPPDLDRVRPPQLADPDPDRGLPEGAGETATVLEAVLDHRHVLEANGSAVAVGDEQVAEGGDVERLSLGSDVHLPLRRLDPARGHPDAARG